MNAVSENRRRFRFAQCRRLAVPAILALSLPLVIKGSIGKIGRAHV
jgi:hypothetical protein